MVFVDLPSRKKTGKRWAASLLAIIAIVMYAWLAWGQHQSPGAHHAFLLRWATVSGQVDLNALFVHGRVFNLFFSLFLHASLWHLVGNGLFLLIFGVPAERAIGSRRLLALFLIGGALANLAAALLIYEPGRILIGASGGISALIGAYLVLFPRAHLGVVVPLGLWLEFVRAPAALLIGLWAALQLIFTFVGPSMGAVAWWAHLAGFLAGAIMAILFRPAVARRARGR
jgi:membrane associated rhomboid family serine protease